MLLASRNRALASVLATFLAPGFSRPCSRLSPGHTSGPCRAQPQELESERSSEYHSFFQSGYSLGLSESCSRLGPGYISGTRLLRTVLSPLSWPHFRRLVGPQPKSLNPSGHLHTIVFFPIKMPLASRNHHQHQHHQPHRRRQQQRQPTPRDTNSATASRHHPTPTSPTPLAARGKKHTVVSLFALVAQSAENSDQSIEDDGRSSSALMPQKILMWGPTVGVIQCFQAPELENHWFFNVFRLQSLKTIGFSKYSNEPL